MQQHAWLVKWWAQELEDPKGYHLSWMVLGIYNYDWYLWHYLYNNYLQQVWGLFTLLFAFGGLIREKNAGTALFSLSMPVSRRRWLFTRLAMALIESVALSLFAVVVVMIGSSVIHQPYSLTQILLHTALMVGRGRLSNSIREFVLLAVSQATIYVCCFTLVLLGVPYLRSFRTTCSTYAISAEPVGSLYFDFAHAMAGPWQLSWATAPWLTLLATWALAALCLTASVAYGDRIDY